MTATDELRRMLDERGVEWMPIAWNPKRETFYRTPDGVGFCADEYADGVKIYTDATITPAQAIEATLGRCDYTYEQWCEISDVVGDAMEYAHDRAIECPDKADPLWNLDEYVNRVLKVAFGSEATLGPEDTYTREDMESQFVRGYSLGCLANGEGWNENEHVLEEEMAALGWARISDTEGAETDADGLDSGHVRKVSATLGRGECHVYLDGNENYMAYRCDACGMQAVRWGDYCPSCGRRVVEVDE